MSPASYVFVEIFNWLPGQILLTDVGLDRISSSLLASQPQVSFGVLGYMHDYELCPPGSLVSERYFDYR